MGRSMERQRLGARLQHLRLRPAGARQLSRFLQQVQGHRPRIRLHRQQGQYHCQRPRVGHPDGRRAGTALHLPLRRASGPQHQGQARYGPERRHGTGDHPMAIIERHQGRTAAQHGMVGIRHRPLRLSRIRHQAHQRLCGHQQGPVEAALPGSLRIYRGSHERYAWTAQRYH